jgi:hypothetical protein
MRQKMITLCPTTWEYASKMKNFSGWVRKQLEEHAKAEVIKTKNQPKFEAQCEDCDLWWVFPNAYQAQYHYCNQCHNACEFKGMVE